MTSLPKLPRLKSVRLAKMLSQEELAEKAGLTRVAITRLERGDVDARFRTVRKLAEALGVEPTELTEAASADA
jgi:transcriptional regulator with XRE-family HTH domain